MKAEGHRKSANTGSDNYRLHRISLRAQGGGGTVRWLRCLALEPEYWFDCGSVWLNARRLHYLRPLLRFLGDKPAKVGRGTWQNRAAQVGDAGFQCTIGQT